MENQKSSPIGTIIAILGAIGAPVVAYFAYTWMFLVQPSTIDYVSFASISLVLLIVGALPGIAIRALLTQRSKAQTKRDDDEDDDDRS